MKSRSNLEAQTRTYLDEVTQDEWTDTEVQREVNAGYMELVTAQMEIYEDLFLKTDTFDTEADKQEYTTDDGLPTDLFKIRRIEINYDTSATNSVARPAVYVPMRAVLRDLAFTNSNITPYRTPAYYFFGSGTGSSGMTIGFIPVPNNSDTDAVKIWYIPIISELSSASSEIEIVYPDRYGKLISLYAAATLLRKGQQEETASSRYILEFEAGMEKMKRQLEDRVSSDPKEIIDTQGDFVDFQHNI